MLCTTNVNAEAGLLRNGAKTGVLQAGRHADFIVLDGDPLQDIAILQDKSRLKAIYLGGKEGRADAKSERKASALGVFVSNVESGLHATTNQRVDAAQAAAGRLRLGLANQVEGSVKIGNPADSRCSARAVQPPEPNSVFGTAVHRGTGCGGPAGRTGRQRGSAEQARQVFANLSEALKSEALTFRNVVKFNTYLLGAANIVKFWTSVANFQRHTQSFRVDPEPGLRSRAWRGDRTWRPRYQP